MGIVVQKYGGSSVADADGIKRVAQRIVNTKKQGHEVVVVVSAMGDTTDDLRDLAEQVTPLPPPRELDMLLTAGERISMALLAMAVSSLGAEVCEIYTDVAGVFTADPRIVPAARKLDRVSHEEMLEMAASGAKILHLRCVEYARRYDVPIHVRTSFDTIEGTWILPDTADTEGDTVEQAIIAGVAHDRSEAKITVVGVPDKVGEAARIFEVLAGSEVNIDMVVQNVSAAATARTDISFTLPREDGQNAMAALAKIQDEVGYDKLLFDDRVGKVSLIGAGMRSHPGITAKFFASLAAAGVNIEMISTSEIRISVIVDEGQIDTAVRATHTAFDLDADEVEAVVYGGTGR